MWNVIAIKKKKLLDIIFLIKQVSSAVYQSKSKAFWEHQNIKELFWQEEKEKARKHSFHCYPIITSLSLIADIGWNKIQVQMLVV